MPIQTCSLPQRPGEVTLLPQTSAFPERETSCLHTKRTHRHTHTRIQTYTQILEHRFKDWKTTNSKEFLNTYYMSSTMLGSMKWVPSKCFLFNWKVSNILIPTGKDPLSTRVLHAFLYSLSNPIHAQVWFILLSRSYSPWTPPHKKLLPSVTHGEWSVPPECPEIIVCSSLVVIHHMLSCPSCHIAFKSSCVISWRVEILIMSHCSEYPPSSQCRDLLYNTPKLLENTHLETFSDSPMYKGMSVPDFWLFS